MMPPARTVLVASVLAACAAGCTRPASTGSAPSASWEYLLDAPPSGSHVIQVEATFHAVGSERLVIAEDTVPFVRALAVKDGERWMPPPRSAGAWLAPACVRECSVRYGIDL